jgi:hypothetical protein
MSADGPGLATAGVTPGETLRLPNLDPNFDNGKWAVYGVYAFMVVVVVVMAALLASAPHASVLAVGVIELGLSPFTVYGLVTAHQRLQVMRKANIPTELVIERDRFVGVLPPSRARPKGGTLVIPFAAVERIEVGSLGGKGVGPWIPASVRADYGRIRRPGADSARDFFPDSSPPPGCASAFALVPSNFQPVRDAYRAWNPAARVLPDGSVWA